MGHTYFSNRGGAGGYLNAYSNGTNDISDCAGITPTGLFPYYDPSTNKYFSPQGFQIISAGADYAFAPGSQVTGIQGAPTGWTFSLLWPQGSAYTTTGPFPQGFDDQSNFSDRPLGVPRN